MAGHQRLNNMMPYISSFLEGLMFLWDSAVVIQSSEWAAHVHKSRGGWVRLWIEWAGRPLFWDHCLCVCFCVGGICRSKEGVHLELWPHSGARRQSFYPSALPSVCFLASHMLAHAGLPATRVLFPCNKPNPSWGLQWVCETDFRWCAWKGNVTLERAGNVHREP